MPIAGAPGFARETLRRKLKRLAELGIVIERDGAAAGTTLSCPFGGPRGRQRKGQRVGTGCSPR